MAVDFTPSQTAAIEWRKQDACVMAGPGSGKTTVLVERYRSLIGNHGFEPHEILAITFTEKAAANMKAKVADQFRNEPEMLREIETAWISTIHGFCARLLRENAITAGIDPGYCVLDARESDEIQFDCIYSALDEITEASRTETLALINALQNPNIAGDLKNAYDAIRSAGKTIARVRAIPSPNPDASEAEMSRRLRELIAGWTGRVTALQQSHRSELLAWALDFAGDPPFNFQRIPPERRPDLRAFEESYNAWAVDRKTAPFRAMIFDVFTRFEDLYRERKVALGALDFNDLERRAIDLLRGNVEVRTRIRAQFRQVMLDEFQDINDQQAQLIDLVRGDDVFFAVGDANQSIYGFRHARPEIFRSYRAAIESAGKHSTELLDNFRSRAQILQCAETLLNAAPGIEPRQLIACADFDEKGEPSIEVLKIQSADKEEAAGREARWIAHRILAVRGAIFDFKDFAVLCRNGESMLPILDAFIQVGIPYVCGRRQSFFLSREGLDITALLRTIANPRDGISLATVLRSPLVRLGDDTLLRMKLLAGSLTGGLNVLARDRAKFDTFEPEAALSLARFIGNLERWRTEQPVISLDLLIVRALDDCGVGIDDNVESFLQLARARGSGKSLRHFVDEIDRMRNAVSAESDLSDRDQGNRVQVMTAHAAKGLEFPVTIVAAMDKGTRRSSAGVTFTPEHGLGLKWKGASNKGIGDSWHASNKAVLKEREQEESNRLLYVAMTRAKEHLILSYSCAVEQRARKPAGEWANLVEGALQPSAIDTEPPLARHYPNADYDEEIQTVDRPAIDGQHDSAVNVTSLAVFAECPRKYYLERYLGWNGGFKFSDPEDLPADTPDTPAAELGTMVHEILAGRGGEHTPEARQLAGVFLAGDLGKRAAASTRAEREWEFIVDIDGTLVRGNIDLWFECEDEIQIVDYKTDTEVNVSKYRPQIVLYAIALEKALGRPPARASLHFLRSDQVEQIPVDEAARLEVRALIAELRAAQDTLRFDLNPGEHCRACHFYRGLCPVAY